MRLYVVDGDDPGVAVPPKRDTEFRARENKTDKVSAVLRYGGCR